MKYGVMITRGQPFHIGHIKVIQQALNENDRVLIIIGSADKSGTERNPFDIKTRRRYFEKLKSYYHINCDRLQVLELPDWSKDTAIPYHSNVGSTNTDYETVAKEWGFYLYYNIVRKINGKIFTLYYNDDTEIVKAWFPEYIWARITLKSTVRDDISSSKVRNAILTENYNYLKETVPYLNKQDIKECHKILEEIKYEA